MSDFYEIDDIQFCDNTAEEASEAKAQVKKIFEEKLEALQAENARLKTLLWKGKNKIMQLHDEIMNDNGIECIGEKCTEVKLCNEIEEALKG